MYATLFLTDKANGGVGGGLSVSYEHSQYTGDSGDKHYMNFSLFFNNQADYGKAFAYSLAIV